MLSLFLKTSVKFKKRVYTVNCVQGHVELPSGTISVIHVAITYFAVHIDGIVNISALLSTQRLKKLLLTNEMSCPLSLLFSMKQMTSIISPFNTCDLFYTVNISDFV